ncbi:signal recognition particle-docking protein FtsY [Candidatus Dependentiae bacterium]|nr:signal recognition particle-docking protein FtsY [Candidatus Dependentiae bacterium]
MFSFIKDKLKKIYSSVTSKLSALFGKTSIDKDTLKELEILLLSADTGVATTRKIITKLENQWRAGALSHGNDLKKALEEHLLLLLAQQAYNCLSPVTLLVGINGSGKTTFAGKRAHSLTKEGKKVLLVAADTFRAAATHQLAEWAKKIGVEVVIGKENQDPASVVFAGCKKFIDENFDALIIDTAGRLQTKINLMKELEKIKKVVTKHLPDTPISTLLTIDSMLGQNSFEQARLFNEATDVSGIVLTKMDGTGKGGIVFGIVDELKIPVAYISFGEQPEQYTLFDKQEYVHDLLNS